MANDRGGGGGRGGRVGSHGVRSRTNLCHRNRELEDEAGALRLVVPYTDVSVVVCNDGLDDGKPETGPAFFRRRIRFEDPFPHVLRDSTSLVGHLQYGNAQERIVARDQDDRGMLFASIHGVVQQVDESSSDLIRVQEKPREAQVLLEGERNRTVGLLIEGDHFTDDMVEVGKRRVDRGHAGKLGEFVDQVLHFLHLADNRIRAFLKDLAVLSESTRVSLLETLGGQLDRRQGVLDLVCDPPGHLSPRSRPLRTNQLGMILEDHDHAHPSPLFVLEHAGPNEEILRLLLKEDANLPREIPRSSLIHLLDHFTDRLHRLPCKKLKVGFPEHRRGPDSELHLHEPIHGLNPALTVQGHHTGAYVPEENLHVSPALFEFDVALVESPLRFLDLHALLLQVHDHPVERVHQDPHFVVRGGLDAIRQVSCRHLPDALCKMLDGRGDAFRKEEPKPGGREEDEQGHHDQGHEDDRLEGDLVEHHLLVPLEGFRDLRHLLNQALLDPPLHDEGRFTHASLFDEVDRHHGLDQLPSSALPDTCYILPVIDLFDFTLLRHEGPGKGLMERRFYQHRPVLCDQIDRIQPVSNLFQPQELPEVLLLPPLEDPFPVQGLLDLLCEEEGVLRLALVVGSRHGERPFQGPLHLHVHPHLDAAGNKRPGHIEEDSGRDERQQHEGGNELVPQAGTQDSPSPLEDQLDHVPDDQEDQQKDQDDVDVDDGEEQDAVVERQCGAITADRELDGGQHEEDEQNQEDEENFPPSPPRVFVVERWVRVFPSMGGMVPYEVTLFMVPSRANRRRRPPSDSALPRCFPSGDRTRPNRLPSPGESHPGKSRSPEEGNRLPWLRPPPWVPLSGSGPARASAEIPPHPTRESRDRTPAIPREQEEGEKAHSGSVHRIW